MTISSIQNVIKARLVDVRTVYGKSYYVSIVQYYSDGTSDECISVDVRVKCKHNEKYRSREFYFVTKN